MTGGSFIVASVSIAFAKSVASTAVPAASGRKRDRGTPALASDGSTERFAFDHEGPGTCRDGRGEVEDASTSKISRAARERTSGSFGSMAAYQVLCKAVYASPWVTMDA